jgi:hypothetical protein
MIFKGGEVMWREAGVKEKEQLVTLLKSFQ